MKLSPLQKVRYQYVPKLPGMLRNGINEICVKEGEATESVADQAKIKALFPNTYGKKEITFEKGTKKFRLQKPLSYFIRWTSTWWTQRCFRLI